LRFPAPKDNDVPGKITSTFTNVLRQAAKQNQSPDPDKQGILCFAVVVHPRHQRGVVHFWAVNDVVLGKHVSPGNEANYPLVIGLQRTGSMGLGPLSAGRGADPHHKPRFGLPTAHHAYRYESD
jgi:hypothetical protein